jgi:Cd2+/Zn2+-exporting ATPase
LAVDKAPGDEVFAGSINGRGALDVRVTKFRRDTTLARITHMVERAQAQRAPSQTLVERFASVYTPAVIILAAALAIVPPLAFGAEWQTWVIARWSCSSYRAPARSSSRLGFSRAAAAAARHGVLVGRRSSRTGGGVRCVAFDKTGTLTYGLPM